MRNKEKGRVKREEWRVKMKSTRLTLLTPWRVHGVRTPAVAMERGVDSGGGARCWRRRGDWVTALEAAGVWIWRSSSLDLGKRFRIYRVWDCESLREFERAGKELRVWDWRSEDWRGEEEWKGKEKAWMGSHVHDLTSGSEVKTEEEWRLKSSG